MLGIVLRKWRIMSELTLKEAAALIGVAPSVLSRIEDGKPIDWKNVGIVMTWLFAGVKEDKSVNPRS